MKTVLSSRNQYSMHSAIRVRYYYYNACHILTIILIWGSECSQEYEDHKRNNWLTGTIIYNINKWYIKNAKSI